jgi:hypothetical protein
MSAERTMREQLGLESPRRLYAGGMVGVDSIQGSSQRMTVSGLSRWGKCKSGKIVNPDRSFLLQTDLLALELSGLAVRPKADAYSPELYSAENSPGRG